MCMQDHFYISFSRKTPEEEYQITGQFPYSKTGILETTDSEKFLPACCFVHDLTHVNRLAKPISMLLHKMGMLDSQSSL